MFARNQDNLLGLSYAEIQKEIFKVINKYYNPKSVVKLSFSDKEDLVWTLIGHIYEQSGKFDPAKGHAVSWMWSVAKNKLNDILKAKCRHIMRYTHIGESDSKESLKINEIEDESSYITQEECIPYLRSSIVVFMRKSRICKTANLPIRYIRWHTIWQVRRRHASTSSCLFC